MTRGEMLSRISPLVWFCFHLLRICCAEFFKISKMESILIQSNAEMIYGFIYKLSNNNSLLFAVLFFQSVFSHQTLCLWAFVFFFFFLD